MCITLYLGVGSAVHPGMSHHIDCNEDARTPWGLRCDSDGYDELINDIVV